MSSLVRWPVPQPVAADEPSSRIITPPVPGVPTYPAVIGGIHPESNNRMGPFVDSNGALYTVTEMTVLDPDPSMRKSTDGGLTWVEVDGANRPTHDDLESLWIVQRGTVLYLLAQRSGTTRVSHHTFNTSDAGASPDTWQLKDEQVHLPGTAPSNQACSLAVRSNGDLLAFYRTDPVSTFQRLAWRKKPSGGSWSAETQVDTTASTNFTQVAVVVGASDKVHIFYKNDTTSAVWHKSLTSADSLSASEVVNDNATTTDDQMMATPPVYVDVGGVERVYVAWKRLSTGFLVGAAIDNDGVPGAEEAISDVAVWEDPTVVVSEQVVATLATDPATGKIYALYADNATHDLWQVVRDGTWGTPVEIADGVEAQLVAASVLTHSPGNGGAKVLGIVYDDNPTGQADAGVPSYTQVEITPPGADGPVPVFETGSTLAGAVRTNSLVPVPASVAADNIIRVLFYLESDGASDPSALTGPDGTWTREAFETTTGDVFRFELWWKRATGSDTGTYTFTHASMYTEADAVRVSGCIASGNPFDGAVQTAEGTGSATSPAVSLTSTGANRLLLWGGATFLGSDTWTPPASFTERSDQASHGSATKDHLTQGSTGSLTGTTDAVGVMAATLAALRPVLVAGGVTGTGAAAFTFAGTAAGVPEALGVAAGTYAFAGTAAGVPEVLGAAAATVGFTGSASGTVTAPAVEGQAQGTYAFTGAAIGSRAVLGAATGSFGFTGDATGIPEVLAAAAAAVTFAGVAAGTVGGVWGPPQNLVATDISSSQIDLVWDAVTGASGYDIERDSVVVVSDHAGTSYSDTGLDPSTQYDYRVRAVG